MIERGGVCGFTFCKSVSEYVDLSYFVMWSIRKLRGWWQRGLGWRLARTLG